ncbi:hypothetical protein J2S43_006414 [Catenuloplanes nepalensis]|uniref:Uncharacterized protein n=1 Tax=Catenuloplanes nepalensis TaxID=587533 RepID=A0ABT9N2H9_9ACTN|nr:insulinase family protein [Catenuloplanes nepalensis]MDP9797902.1 hypothetical protein [Catenuloplanes nepalensis]
MIVTESEIDGVPVLHAPAPGPLRAGLVFRAGRADETAATAGVTRLAEALVLHRAGAPDGDRGGVSPVVTTFTARGTADEVTAHLHRVCAALAADPAPHLDPVRAALVAEAAHRAPTIFDSLAVVRHGAQRHGLAGLPEWGLHTLTAEDVNRWVSTYFTRENAVLWLTGETPDGLTLALPSGRRRPVPDALPTPGRFGVFRPPASDMIVRDEIQPAGAATEVYASLLERVVFQATGRIGGDGAHRVRAHYRPRGDGFAAVTVLAEVFAGDPGPIAGEFLDALAALRARPIAPEQVAAVVQELDRALLAPDATVARLPRQAFGLLTGAPEPSADELRSRLRTVTAEEVGALAAASREAELLLTSWNGLIGPSPAGPEPVFGRRFRSLENRKAALTMDGTGITGSWPDVPPVTVPFASAAVLLTWPDGGRRLVGPDARYVDVEPTLYETAPDVIPAVDAAVPADRHVPMPPRDPDAIPVPRPRGRHPIRYGGAGALFLGLVAWVLGWAALMFAITPGASSAPVTLFAVFLVAWFWGALRLRRVRNTTVAHRRLTRARKAAVTGPALAVGRSQS